MSPNRPPSRRQPASHPRHSPRIPPPSRPHSGLRRRYAQPARRNLKTAANYDTRPRAYLALLAAAILNRRRLSLSELARPWMPALPQNHHQRKSASFASSSNPRFDRIQTQCALMPTICHLAGLKMRIPIMIDWSDLGRKRGLPLLTWAMDHDELNPSQNQLEEAFIARLLRNLPDAIRPPLLADRGFGRASLLRWLQEMPRHTGRTVDYVVRLKGNARIQTADGYRGCCGSIPCLPAAMCFCPE